MEQTKMAIKETKTYPDTQEGRQAFFDKTVKHLRSMTERSGRSGQPRIGITGTIQGAFYCQYRDSEGRKCAIGVHIPEGHPGQTETGPVSELIQSHPDLLGVAIPEGGDGIGLAKKLQATHDDWCNWREEGGFDGELALSETATRFGLSFKRESVA